MKKRSKIFKENESPIIIPSLIINTKAISIQVGCQKNKIDGSSTKKMKAVGINAREKCVRMIQKVAILSI